MDVHLYSIGFLQQRRKCQSRSHKIRVTHTCKHDIDINFTPVLPLQTQSNVYTPSRPSKPCTAFMWAYCTNLGYPQQRRQFNSRDPEVTPAGPNVRPRFVPLTAKATRGTPTRSYITCMDVYCFSIGDLQQCRKLQSWSPKMMMIWT